MYEDTENSYPVLYLLHGMGGDEEAWMTLGRASQILDNLIAQGKAEPMIMVMPNETVRSKVYDNIDGTLAAQKANGYTLYWIAIGKEDFLYQANIDFRKKLDAMEFPYIYRESEGGHTWRNWRIYLSEFLPIIFKTR